LTIQFEILVLGLGSEKHKIFLLPICLPLVVGIIVFVGLGGDKHEIFLVPTSLPWFWVISRNAFQM